MLSFIWYYHSLMTFSTACTVVVYTVHRSTFCIQSRLTLLVSTFYEWWVNLWLNIISMALARMGIDWAIDVWTIVTGNAEPPAILVPDRSYRNAVRSRPGSLGIAIWIASFCVPFLELRVCSLNPFLVFWFSMKKMQKEEKVTAGTYYFTLRGLLFCFFVFFGPN